MDDKNQHHEYEQRKNLGKIVGERKYQSKANKDVEKKLNSLSKKINDLQHQRRFTYKNSVKVKRAIHNQVNQIVKCFRARERNLLSNVDEAFIAQDSSISEELSRLLSTRAHCQTLYVNIEDFKEHLDVVTKIHNTLSTVNINEKPSLKPLEFSSNFEQMKIDAAAYGCLNGDFVKRFDEASAVDALVFTSDPLLNDVVPEQHLVSCLQSSFQKVNYLSGKIPKRERTESGDSFEIIDLLENVHCQDKDSPMGERDSSPKVVKFCSTKEDNSPSNALENLEKYCEVSKNAKFPDIQRRIAEMQQQLENLVTADPMFIPLQENGFDHTIEYAMEEFEAHEEKTFLDVANESWLLKSPRRIDALDTDKKNNYCSANAKINPADLIKKAFSPYFANENVENWLSKN